MLRQAFTAQVGITLFLAALLWLAGHEMHSSVLRRDAHIAIAWRYPTIAALKRLPMIGGLSLLQHSPAGGTSGTAPSFKLAWPAVGPILSDRSGRLVMAMTAGTPVEAASSGTIESIRTTFGSGFSVVERIAGNITVTYAGLGPVTVLRTAHVQSGTLIGYVAHPRTARPTLVLTVLRHGGEIDPLQWLRSP